MPGGSRHDAVAASSYYYDRIFSTPLVVESGTIFVAWGDSWKKALPEQDEAIRTLLPHFAQFTGQGSMAASTASRQHKGYELRVEEGDYCIVGKGGNSRKIFVMPSSDKGAKEDGFWGLIHNL